MSIDCDCSLDGYEGPEFCHDSFPIARKTHVCCECRENILPGQKYHKVVGIWDGRWETFKTCMPCYQIRERYCPRGYIFEMLRETISECLGFDYLEIPEDADD